MKNPKKKVAPPKSTPASTVRDVAAAGGACLEAAAIFDYLGRELPATFAAFGDKAPPCLVDDGVGSRRAASVDALATVTGALAGLAEEHRKRADLLLGKVVDAEVPVGASASGVGVPTVVEGPRPSR